MWKWVSRCKLLEIKRQSMPLPGMRIGFNSNIRKTGRRHKCSLLNFILNPLRRTCQAMDRRVKKNRKTGGAKAELYICHIEGEVIGTSGASGAGGWTDHMMQRVSWGYCSAWGSCRIWKTWWHWKFRRCTEVLLYLYVYLLNQQYYLSLYLCLDGRLDVCFVPEVVLNLANV